jgi:hypothetical protein
MTRCEAEVEIKKLLAEWDDLGGQVIDAEARMLEIDQVIEDIREDWPEIPAVLSFSYDGDMWHGTGIAAVKGPWPEACQVSPASESQEASYREAIEDAARQIKHGHEVLEPPIVIPGSLVMLAGYRLADGRYLSAAHKAIIDSVPGGIVFHDHDDRVAALYGPDGLRAIMMPLARGAAQEVTP